MSKSREAARAKAAMRWRWPHTFAALVGAGLWVVVLLCVGLLLAQDGPTGSTGIAAGESRARENDILTITMPAEDTASIALAYPFSVGESHPDCPGVQQYIRAEVDGETYVICLDDFLRDLVLNYDFEAVE